MSNEHHRRLRAIAEAEGFTLVRCKRHLIWRHPNGAQVTTSVTPSDYRALMKARTVFRRAASTPSLRATA